MKTLINNLFYILVGLLTGGLVWLVSIPPRGTPVTLLPPPSPQPLLIHVAGAVAAPGVYALPQNARIRDAVDAAGGFLSDTPPQTINLAAQLSDGQQILVPEEKNEIPGQNDGTNHSRLININTASQAILESLPGVGPSTARAIIEFREQYGDFTDILDLMKVKGIGPATYEKLKLLITVGP